MVKKNSILNIHKNYLYILGIVLFLFIIYYFYKNHIFESFDNINEYGNGNGNKNVNVNLKYFRCDSKKLGTINNEVFNDYGIIKDNNNWDIYVPCGYNHAEKELLTIQINGFKRNNKFIFGINGCDSIVSKNKIWETLVECYGREEASLYMPESYVLHSKKEMDLFRKNFKSRNIYILKKNVQRKRRS